MPNLLEQLEIDEVSLVDRGANPGAQVLLVKRHGTKKEGEMEPISKLDSYEAMMVETRKIQRDGESEEAAFSRFMKTERGGLMYRAYREAQGSAVPDAPANKVTKSDPRPSKAYDKLAVAAQAVAKAEGISFERAFSKVYTSADCAPLREAYLAELRA